MTKPPTREARLKGHSKSGLSDTAIARGGFYIILDLAKQVRVRPKQRQWGDYYAYGQYRKPKNPEQWPKGQEQGPEAC